MTSVGFSVVRGRGGWNDGWPTADRSMDFIVSVARYNADSLSFGITHNEHADILDIRRNGEEFTISLIQNRKHVLEHNSSTVQKIVTDGKIDSIFVERDLRLSFENAWIYADSIGIGAEISADLRDHVHNITTEILPLLRTDLG